MDEIDMIRAKAKELKYAFDKCNDERTRFGVMYEESLKEKADLEKKIEFLSGQIEAYKYCIKKYKGGE